MNRRPGPANRLRAKRACRTCNARRVKCNVTEQQPCRNCIAAGVPCELIESRRGKHPRQKKGAAANGAATRATQPSPHPTLTAGTGTSPALQTVQDHQGHETYSLLNDSPFVSPQSLFDNSTSYDPGTTATTAPSPPDSLNESVYLGESTSLMCIQNEDAHVDGNGGPDSTQPSLAPRLFHAISKPPDNQAMSSVMEGPRATPGKRIRDELFDAYFRWFHPHFPILDQSVVVAQHDQDSLSQLLLHAILFLGAQHCDEIVLNQAGHPDRHYAKKLFYTRAKSMYDADTEKDFLIVIQALFLLSFWRGGPFEKKDTRHWLGIAITMCQSKALHRKSMRKNGHIDRLKRRIWWCLYIRERQCASALGLPIRIRDDDCDVERLTLADFDIASGPTSSSLTKQAAEYVMQSCTLSQFLGDIVCSTYLPNQKPSAVRSAQMLDQLHDWQDQLPKSMQINNDSDEGLQFYAVLLQMAYNNLIILVYRSAFLKDTSNGGGRGPKAVIQAACRNCRLLEDLMSNSLLQHGQLHLITTIFNTLCIHTVQCNRNTGLAKSLAEQRAHLCLIGLKELGTRWEITNWILDLFLHYLNRSPARRFRAPKTSEQYPTSKGAAKISLPSQSGHDDQTTAANSLVALHQSSPASSGPSYGNAQDGERRVLASDFDDLLMTHIENDFLFGEGNGLSCEPSDADLLALLGINAFSPSSREMGMAV